MEGKQIVSKTGKLTETISLFPLRSTHTLWQMYSLYKFQIHDINFINKDHVSENNEQNELIS